MNDRLQIAAMLLQGVVTHGYIGDVTDNNIGLCVELTDTLLAECGEPKETLTAEDLELARLRGYEQGVEQMRKDAQPRKVEVTEEMGNAIYNLCLQIMKEPIEMYWFCERLSDIINGGDA